MKNPGNVTPLPLIALNIRNNMSNIISYILNKTTNLITSALEQAVENAQTVQDSDEINNHLSKIKEERISKCDHGVHFDSKASANMSSHQVRQVYPRLFGKCPKGCGYEGIAYASFEHYVSGDW